ncbi:NAD(P)/FAD-dependent oxidoreductase [Pseudonocardia spirodelae]|uniref:FAD-dependent oxidoreductase n=1 Tax=Pseudonocardia spirodelae TaxID=3133431 RepID=A0ABU8T3X0_9PSEU
MSVPEHVLVVGAGLAGLRTVENLRRDGYEGRISLVGAEEHLPYDRPPLSKQFLAGDWERTKVDLCTAEDLEELGVRTHLGRAATALRPGDDGSEVELDDGTVLHADAVVLAVGVTSRVLDDQPDSAHLLRAVDESAALRDALAQASSLLVVGAGFIGAEVASTARDRGVAVTVVESGTVPMARLLGEQAGALVARLMTDAGVDLRTGVSVSSMDAGGATLSDGTTVRADEIVVGVGGMLDLGWLEAAGVDVTDGVPCDHRGRVDGLPGVWAAGDAAAWADPDTGTRTRLEHWTSASDQAAAVAADITGSDLPPAAVPFFWSDQFGLKIQLVGRPDRADSLLALHGEGLDGGPVKGTVLGYLRGDELVAVAGFGAARLVARYRRPLAEGADRAATLELRDQLS